ncbi:MAG: formylglycine-generating enzyme family protein [Desulfarculaceae bacterium]|jgi:formylglycine-generating enzyme required for sulfatase activity
MSRGKLVWLAALTLILALSPVPVWGGPAPRKTTNALGMEFVLIPAGSFLMGSPTGEPGRNEDETQHQVTISKPFYMQTTEVTRRQWWQVMGRSFFGGRRGRPDMPVARVSWKEVKEFIQKLNQRGQGVYRLPTEAEWEYACRAGTTTAYSFGQKITCSQAMFANNHLRDDGCMEHCQRRGIKADRPAPVKSFPPNPWGLYDMHGNLWEWCSDRYGPYPKGPVTDPQGGDEATSRIRRGGSFFGDAAALRCANRNYAYPSVRYRTLGFRLVRQAP